MTPGGSSCLASLTELKVAQVDIVCKAACDLAAALRNHPTLRSLELWNVKLKDEGALALGTLAGADGNFALSNLNLGRNLISGHTKDKIQAMVDIRRVELSMY